MSDIIKRLQNAMHAESAIYSPRTTEAIEAMREAKEEIKRLRAKTQWQPIETAPKDGKIIVCADTDNGPDVDVVECVGGGDFLHEGECTFEHSWYFSPTNWMPLPDAPESE